MLINGSARAVGAIAQLTRLFQTGYLYFYALVMLLGVFGADDLAVVAAGAHACSACEQQTKNKKRKNQWDC